MACPEPAPVPVCPFTLARLLPLDPKGLKKIRIKERKASQPLLGVFSVFRVNHGIVGWLLLPAFVSVPHRNLPCLGSVVIDAQRGNKPSWRLLSAAPQDMPAWPDRANCIWQMLSVSRASVLVPRSAGARVSGQGLALSLCFQNRSRVPTLTGRWGWRLFWASP